VACDVRITFCKQHTILAYYKDIHIWCKPKSCYVIYERSLCMTQSEGWLRCGVPEAIYLKPRHKTNLCLSGRQM
jgi:hypothetical protein